MKFFFFVLMLLLVGCVSLTPQVAIDTKLDEPATTAFGTLADANNPVDTASAACYTKLAAYRYRAARLLRNKQIEVETAKSVQSIADAYRTRLDKSVQEKDLAMIANVCSSLTYAELRLGATK